MVGNFSYGGVREVRVTRFGEFNCTGIPDYRLTRVIKCGMRDCILNNIRECSLTWIVESRAPRCGAFFNSKECGLTNIRVLSIEKFSILRSISVDRSFSGIPLPHIEHILSYILLEQPFSFCLLNCVNILANFPEEDFAAHNNLFFLALGNNLEITEC